MEQAVDFDHWSQVGAGKLEIAEAVARIPRPQVGLFWSNRAVVDGSGANKTRGPGTA